MKENPYLRFSTTMLRSFEKIYKEDIKDSSLSRSKRDNAKTKLDLVREAMKLRR